LFLGVVSLLLSPLLPSSFLLAKVCLRLVSGYPELALPAALAIVTRRTDYRARTELAVCGWHLRFLLCCRAAALIDDPPPGPSITFSRVTLMKITPGQVQRIHSALRALVPKYIVINSLGKHIPGLRCVEYVVQPEMQRLMLDYSAIFYAEMEALGVAPEIYFPL